MQNKTRITIIVLTLIFLILASFLFFTKKSVDSKIKTVQVFKTKEEQNKNFEYGNKLRQNVQKLLEQETIIENSFIDANQVVDFIQSLEQSAQINNVQITTEKIEQGAEEKISKGSVIPATITLRVEGGYENSISFLKTILNDNKKLNIIQMGMYKTGEEYMIRVQVTGMMFLYE